MQKRCRHGSPLLLLALGQHIPAQVILDALDKPRSITNKTSSADIVTETDKAAEDACLKVVRRTFGQHHAILGEEGGLTGNPRSDYLWCIDPLDGTTNFAHGYPSFAVSIGVLRHAVPVAACVVEFTGGPGTWVTRTYTATRNGGAFMNGTPLCVSRTKELSSALLVTDWPSPLPVPLNPVCAVGFNRHQMTLDSRETPWCTGGGVWLPA